MIKAILFLLISSLSYSYCWSQSLSERKEPQTNSILKTQNSTNPGVEIPAKHKPADTLHNSTTTARALPDVLFATNEDCDLYINDEFKGSVLKSEHKYIKLAPGPYIYKAKSKSAFGELKESFIVKDGGLNEVFMDLLYIVDIENNKSKNSKNKTKAYDRPLVQNQKKSAGSKPEENGFEKNAEAEKEIINALLSNMSSIKGGSFIMGNDKAPAADELEHPVAVSSMRFGKYEVTQQQWERIMGYNPSNNKHCSTCPVENVSWEEVMKFIKKINITSNKKFRLPTEAEWEYVAKIGGRAEIEKAGGPEEYIKKTTWYFGNSDKKTHPVGQKSPNAAGIYDLLGNVSEWCSDWYGSYYYKEDDSQMDPEGPPLGKEKVIRGGSFIEYSGDRFRPSLRNKLKPTGKTASLGFRLVMDQN